MFLRIEIFGEAFDFAFAPFPRADYGVTTAKYQGVINCITSS